MGTWFFASDLHGHTDRYSKLFSLIRAEKPAVVLMGGDLLPNPYQKVEGPQTAREDFIAWLAEEFQHVANDLNQDTPEVMLILGNDDPRSEEEAVRDWETQGVWHYAHGRRHEVDGRPVFGYACVPPSPFLLKDWERYDVSRFVDPGSVSPEEGQRTVPADPDEVRYGTIAQDLDALVGDADLSRTVLLFHAPPYRGALDRAALDGKMVEHVPLDVHVGSIAIQRFIDKRQPLLTLHGHIHESVRLTGAWRELRGKSFCFSAAHDGPELALVDFDPDQLENARRRLL